MTISHIALRADCVGNGDSAVRSNGDKTRSFDPLTCESFSSFDVDKTHIVTVILVTGEGTNVNLSIHFQVYWLSKSLG